MPTASERERVIPVKGIIHYTSSGKEGTLVKFSPPEVLASGKQFTVSEGHPINRKTGKYDAGGPFYTSSVMPFFNDGHVSGAISFRDRTVYSGPIRCDLPTRAEMEGIGYANVDRQYGDKNESHMTEDGTTAISLCNPINPAAQLGTTLAETFREGIPSLPGIESWEHRTQILKGLGSEYLNYQFGWAPLRSEVQNVSKAARQHRDIMKQYQRGEGSDTHRRFDFPSQVSVASNESNKGVLHGNLPSEEFLLDTTESVRTISLVRETKRWFEGSFTYGLPSSTDSWRQALGFGSQADQVLGIALSPDTLWELAPWSWAVDWFSNAGDVINNVTNFGLAGLVMRYGYMMEESIERVTASQDGAVYAGKHIPGEGFLPVKGSPASSGYTSTTKRRVPANPFGFGISWQGLSPTQLAITAALGITRVL